MGAFPGVFQVYHVAPATQESGESLQGHARKENLLVQGADPPSLLPPKRVSSSHSDLVTCQAYIVAAACENTHVFSFEPDFSAKGQAGLLGSLNPAALYSAPKPTLPPPHPQRVLQGPECLRQQHRVPENFIELMEKVTPDSNSECLVGRLGLGSTPRQSKGAAQRNLDTGKVWKHADPS